MKKAFITGITGQDGSYLAEYLLGRGYAVHGLVRPVSSHYDQESEWRIQPFRDRLSLHRGDLGDWPAMQTIVQSIQPDECYHLAAQTFALASPEEEADMLTANTLGTHHLLLAMTRHSPETRLFFAGSSEMFGRASVSPQNEETPFNPRSLYGVSKVMSHQLVRYCREHKNLFAGTGILYNHESPRRGSRFVTRKITATAAKIKLGLEKELRLGNIESERDWGYAGDYVAAMHACLQSDRPDDYVIATGQSHTVKAFLEAAFGELDLSYEPYLVTDPEFFRPKEPVPLVGDAAKIRNRLGWEPEVPFEELVRKMVRADLEYFQKLLQ